MKRQLIIILSALVLLSIVGCKKFLEQQPYNRLSVDDIFKDFDGARTTLVGLYDNLKSSSYYLKDFYIYPELTGGNIKYSRTANLTLQQSYNFLNDPINNEMTAFYRTAYSTIYGANNVLKYINDVTDASQAQKNRMLADAYSIRALAHFDLVRVFALPYNFTAGATHPAIALKTFNAPTTNPADEPATAKAVYDQIVTDLDSAISLYNRSVPIYTGGNSKTFLSADAAKALLSRVTLYKQDWARSIALTTQLITGGNYSLIPTSLYVESWSKKNISSESIFELAYGNRIGGSLGEYFNPLNVINAQLATTNDLLSLYNPADVRNASSMFINRTINGTTFYYTKKYQGMNDSANNIKIIRLSELYLNRAEAYAESNNLVDALADLNTIRLRANPSAPNFVSTDKQVIINEILVERRRELAFEGHTFFDFARKKKNITRADCTGSNCSLNYPDPRFAVPIPLPQ